MYKYIIKVSKNYKLLFVLCLFIYFVLIYVNLINNLFICSVVHMLYLNTFLYFNCNSFFFLLFYCFGFNIHLFVFCFLLQYFSILNLIDDHMNFINLLKSVKLNFTVKNVCYQYLIKSIYI